MRIVQSFIEESKLRTICKKRKNNIKDSDGNFDMSFLHLFIVQSSNKEFLSIYPKRYVANFVQFK